MYVGFNSACRLKGPFRIPLTVAISYVWTQCPISIRHSQLLFQSRTFCLWISSRFRAHVGSSLLEVTSLRLWASPRGSPQVFPYRWLTKDNSRHHGAQTDILHGHAFQTMKRIKLFESALAEMGKGTIYQGKQKLERKPGSQCNRLAMQKDLINIIQIAELNLSDQCHG